MKNQGIQQQKIVDIFLLIKFKLKEKTKKLGTDIFKLGQNHLFTRNLYFF